MASVPIEIITISQTAFFRLLHLKDKVVSSTKTSSKGDHMSIQVPIAASFKPGLKQTYKEIANIFWHLLTFPKILCFWHFLLINT